MPGSVRYYFDPNSLSQDKKEQLRTWLRRQLERPPAESPALPSNTLDRRLLLNVSGAWKQVRTGHWEEGSDVIFVGLSANHFDIGKRLAILLAIARVTEVMTDEEFLECSVPNLARSAVEASMAKHEVGLGVTREGTPVTKLAFSRQGVAGLIGGSWKNQNGVGVNIHELDQNGYNIWTVLE